VLGVTQKSFGPFSYTLKNVKFCLPEYDIICREMRDSFRDFTLDNIAAHEHGKNGFVTATKLGTKNIFLLLQPKILMQQPNVLVIELDILLL